MVNVNNLGLHAYIAHPTSEAFVSYFKGVTGRWFALDSRDDGTVDVRPVASEDVQDAVFWGFQIMFKGVQA